jgi:hypothetical protein
MAMSTLNNENFVRIIPLEPDWSQPAIVRLGPPPGNARTLIRASERMGLWNRSEGRETAAGIVRLEVEPRPDEVVWALAREMAWRWYNGRDPFATKTTDKRQGTSLGPRKFLRYADVEKAFVEQALNRIPGMPLALAQTLDLESPQASATGSTCVCTDGGVCCTATVGTATEG